MKQITIFNVLFSIFQEQMKPIRLFEDDGNNIAYGVFSSWSWPSKVLQQPIKSKNTFLTDCHSNLDSILQSMTKLLDYSVWIFFTVLNPSRKIRYDTD